MNVLIFASLMTFPSLSSSAPTGGGNTNASYRVCNTSVCIERAKMINDSLNVSVDPCDDFYSYACGGWIDKHPIPQSKSSIGNFHLLHDELQRTLKYILGNMTLVKENQNITDKLAAAYNACLEVPTKGDQIPVLRHLMNNSGFGQWPKMPSEDETPSKKGNCTDVLTNISIHVLFPMYVDRDLTKLTSYAIQLDQLNFPLVGRNQLIQPNDTKNEKIIAAYRTVVTTALKLMKENSSEDELSQLAYGLVDFEGQLANLTAPPEERRNILELYHRTNISALQNDFPNVPLLVMLNKQFSHVNITLNESETIELFAKYYYDKLNTFLEEVECDMLYNFAGMRMALGWAGSASEEFRNSSLNLTKVSTGVVVDMERWEKCVSAVNYKMPEITGYLYVQQKFSEEAKREVEDLSRRIKDVFNETILQIDWMDNKTRAAAEDKLTRMISKIGYPTWLLNTTYLEQLYKYVPNLNLSSTYLEMSYNIDGNNWLRQLLNLGKPYDANSTWIVGPAIVNAFYNPSANEMVYPAGILQGVFYQHGLPRSLNFGAIGMVVGHEMTHGFDDTGSQFDARGALKQWWTNGTRANFNDKAQCFQWQYGNITDEEANMTLNGINTLGENIADNGGMRMAYQAYEKLLVDECYGEDTRLPGLEHLSGKKLFFIAEAMIWCQQMRKERRQLLIQYDPHSPAEYRVNLPMQNMEQFAEVFECPANKTMNPEHRCLLW